MLTDLHSPDSAGDCGALDVLLDASVDVHVKDADGWVNNPYCAELMLSHRLYDLTSTVCSLLSIMLQHQAVRLLSLFYLSMVQQRTGQIIGVPLHMILPKQQQQGSS